MAIFKIAVVGNTEEINFIEETGKDLVLEDSKENSIEFINITGKTKNEISYLGAMNGVMYFDDVHNSSEIFGALKDLISLQDSISDLSIFALSHNKVLPENHQQEDERIMEYYDKSEDGKENIKVFPVTINSSKELKNYMDGILKTSATLFFDVANEVEMTTQEKVDKMTQIVIDATTGKHDYTAGHVQRVSSYVAELVKYMDFSEKEKNECILAAKLHDIGKIGIPDNVLASSKGLNEEEVKQMRYHTTMGAGLLEMVISKEPELFEIITPEVIKGIKYHHKDYDGYHNRRDRHNGNEAKMDKVNGENIGKYALTITVADCLDTMTSQRAYNIPKHILNVFRDIYNNKGLQFSPKVADTALEMLGNQIASIGYDPLTMFSKISSSSKYSNIDIGLRKFFEERKEKIIPNKECEEGKYCDLGFRLDENGYFEFEGKDAPIRDINIAIKSEMAFQKKQYMKNKGKDTIITPEENEMIENMAIKKIQDTDLEGKAAINRAKKDREIVSNFKLAEEILEATKSDKEYRLNNYQEARKVITEMAKDQAEANLSDSKEQSNIEKE